MFKVFFITAVYSLFFLSQSCIAQTMEESPSSTFEVAYRAGAISELDAIAASTRDAAMNRVITQSPKWSLSATATGNLVNVVTTGSNNTVVVNSSQINTGSQQANVGFLSKANPASVAQPSTSASAANEAVSSGLSGSAQPTYATFK